MPDLRPAVILGKGEKGNSTRIARALKKGIFVYPDRKDTIKACVYVIPHSVINAGASVLRNVTPDFIRGLGLVSSTIVRVGKLPQVSRIHCILAFQTVYSRYTFSVSEAGAERVTQ